MNHCLLVLVICWSAAIGKVAAQADTTFMTKGIF